MTTRQALDRTLLLMRDELDASVSDDTLLGALTGTTVVLLADRANISSHAAQAAFVTTAMLMARSGHRIFLCAPDITLVGAQPPLRAGGMIERLLEVGTNLVPGVEFICGMPSDGPDLAIALGDTPFLGNARRRVRLNATAWSGKLAPEERSSRWAEPTWPIGAMTAAALAAGEAFKIAMRKLGPFFRNPDRLATTFADTLEITFAVAPPNAPLSGDVGRFDCISGGAITNAALYVLARVQNLRAGARVIEPDIGDETNLNRYMLLRHSAVGNSKARDLADVCREVLSIDPVESRYGANLYGSIAPLAPSVLVGVDHIPSRWEVQRAGPRWLGIGATSHWSAMASFHQPGIGCAQCLHPSDDPNDAPIPTVAFVSFWSGILTAAYLLRHRAGERIRSSEQQIYLTALRPENPFWACVPLRARCPTCTRSCEQQRGVAA
jgi:hypothetical protein